MFDTQELRAQVPAEVAGPAPLQLPAAAPQPMHLLDRLNAVFKHRRLAGVAFLLVVTTMMVQTYSTIPVYQAFSRVQIQDERTTQVGNLNANDPAFWQDPEPYYRTQYEVIRSRGLARRVVRKLNLADEPALQRHRAAAARSDLAGPPGARRGEHLGAQPDLESGARPRSRRPRPTNRRRKPG